MKLYRITVITPSKNIERGVWADTVDIDNGHIVFADVNDDLIASYPLAATMITSVETKEEYDNRKAK
jgi:hypothetical protein